MPDFNFDEEIDRREVPALKHHSVVLGNDGAHLFPAGVADMDFRVAPAITKAMSARVDHGVFGYEAVPKDLMPALTAWLKSRHGWAVDEAHVLRAPNVLNALAMSANLFTSPGDGIVIQPPVFFDFADIITENGRRIVENPLLHEDGRYTMDFAGLERLASDPATRMLFLCNPHNPVGRVWTRAELLQLDEICRRHNVLVVSDEIHGDLVFPGHVFTPFASLGDLAAVNSITCLSPAKSFNIAACSSAFTVVADEDKRRVFQAENSRLTVNKNNAFASAAMVAAYRNGGEWLDQALIYLQGNLDLLRANISDIPGVALVEPEGTFLAWLDFRGLALAPETLTEFLRAKAGWAITRGPAFGPSGEGFGRMNFACTRARLRDALDSLSRAVKETQ